MGGGVVVVGRRRRHGNGGDSCCGLAEDSHELGFGDANWRGIGRAGPDAELLVGGDAIGCDVGRVEVFGNEIRDAVGGVGEPVGNAVQEGSEEAAGE